MTSLESCVISFNVEQELDKAQLPRRRIHKFEKIKMDENAVPLNGLSQLEADIKRVKSRSKARHYKDFSQLNNDLQDDSD